MQPEFPYQIVTFLGKEPNLYEPVYSGNRGWYAQVAIKRRFTLKNIAEAVFIKELQQYFAADHAIKIITGELVKPERMPVQVVSITNQIDLKLLHIDFLNYFSEKVVSKYPDREGENYYAHITAEYDGKFIIPVDQYERKKFTLNNIWLLKDTESSDSLAYANIR